MKKVASVDLRSGPASTVPTAETGPAELDATCRRAAAAAPALTAMGLAPRAEMLEAMGAELLGDRDEIISVADQETALGEPRLTAELNRTAYQLHFFADVIRDGNFLEATIDHATKTEIGRLPDLRRMLVALGPVGVFGASNFPLLFSVPGGDTASALAAGCPVVAKAHPAHPATSERCAAALARAAASAGAPDGTVALIQGMDAGSALVRHRVIRAVGFTGSQHGGRALFDLARERPDPIPFYGELGSVNPVVVTSCAANERPAEIARGYAASFTASLGQYCTKPGLLFVPTGRTSDELRAAITDALEDVAPGPMLSADIANAFRAGVERLGATDGVEELILKAPNAVPDTDFVAPRLFRVSARRLADQSASVLREECFGPVAVIVEYADEEELVTALGSLDAGLSAAIEIGDGEVDLPRRIGELLVGTVGRFVVNGFTTGVGLGWGIHHGGPYPATTSVLHSSVGASAIRRWMRPICYQSTPDALLPRELREDNPLGLPRRVDGVLVAGS